MLNTLKSTESQFLSMEQGDYQVLHFRDKARLDTFPKVTSLISVGAGHVAASDFIPPLGLS